MVSKNRDCCVLIFSLFLLLYLCPSNYCYEIYNITSSQALSQGQTLLSPSQIFELGFFSPNNSANHLYIGIWFKEISPRKVVWVANRESPIQFTNSKASLTIGSKGNLELLDGKNESVWSTNATVTSSRSVAVLADNGDFLLKDGTSGDQLWHSFQNPSDTFLPGAVIGFNRRTGESYRLTSWKTDTDPSPGNFVSGISLQTPPQAFIWIKGSIPYWRSGPWDKSRFIGIPNMNPIYQSLNLIEDPERGTTYLHFNLHNSSNIFSYLVLTSEGALNEMQKDKGGDWYVEWELPKSKCVIYGTCGPFGVCKESESPICECLKGFVPKSIQEWRNGNWTGGCVRRSQLLCKKNTSSPSWKEGKKDGFLKMPQVKLPDFYQFIEVDYRDSHGCKRWCLNNCSCLAYAYVDTIGCLVWSDGLIDVQSFSFGGEDLFVHLAPSELGGGRKTRNIIISLVAVFTGGTLGAIVFVLYKSRARQKGNIEENTELTDLIQHESTELPFFDFGTILVATNHFCPTNKLGQGGFGSVYKGKLQDGTKIAVIKDSLAAQDKAYKSLRMR